MAARKKAAAATAKVQAFDIGGRVFELRPPVLGQLALVAQIIADLVPQDADPLEALTAAGAVSRFMAAVLVERGQRVSEMDQDEVALHLSDHATGQQAGAVVIDFFNMPGVAQELISAGSARNVLASVAQTYRIEAQAGPRSEPTSSGPASS